MGRPVKSDTEPLLVPRKWTILRPMTDGHPWPFSNLGDHRNYPPAMAPVSSNKAVEALCDADTVNTRHHL